MHINTKLIAMGGVALLPLFNAAGVTIDQLTSKQGWTETIFCNDWNNKEIDACGGVRLERVSDTQLKIVGFKEGTGDFMFTLVDDNGNATTDGTMLSYAYDDASGDKYNSLLTGVENKYQYVSGYGNFMLYNMGRGSNNQPYVPYWRGRIKETGDGNYEIAFPESSGRYDSSVIVACAATLTSTNQTDGGSYIGRYYLTSYDANATASDTRKEYNASGTSMTGTSSREYAMQINFNEDNTFTLLNLANKGNAIDRSNTTTLFTGTYDLDTEDFTIDASQYGALWHAWSIVRSGYTVVGAKSTNYNAVLRHFNSASSRDDILKGRITAAEASHNQAEEGWVSNGGKRRTNKGYEITIPDYTYEYIQGSPSLPAGWSTWANSYHNTLIECRDDVTVEVELDLHHHGSLSDTGVFVGADIHTISDKANLADHYEVLMVAGHLNSIDDFREHLCSENGHDMAQVISLSAADTTHDHRLTNQSRIAAEEVSGNDYSISKLIPAEHIENVHPDGEYSFFIKTVYKDPSLTPTFHSLQYMKDYNTGVEEPQADMELQGKITIEDRRITVCGVGEMEITTASGACVYRGNAGTVDMAPGFYIVKAGTTVEKVYVR